MLLVLLFFPGHSHISPQDAPWLLQFHYRLNYDATGRLEPLSISEAIFHNSSILFLVFSIDFSLKCHGEIARSPAAELTPDPISDPRAARRLTHLAA